MDVAEVIVFCNDCRVRQINVTDVCDDPACREHTCLDCGWPNDEAD